MNPPVYHYGIEHRGIENHYKQGKTERTSMIIKLQYHIILIHEDMKDHLRIFNFISRCNTTTIFVCVVIGRKFDRSKVILILRSEKDSPLDFIEFLTESTVLTRRMSVNILSTSMSVVPSSEFQQYFRRVSSDQLYIGLKLEILKCRSVMYFQKTLFNKSNIVDTTRKSIYD